jgi:hypothetical protein
VINHFGSRRKLEIEIISSSVRCHGLENTDDRLVSVLRWPF